jgi:hypothetical protein
VKKDLPDPLLGFPIEFPIPPRKPREANINFFYLHPCGTPQINFKKSLWRFRRGTKINF